MGFMLAMEGDFQKTSLQAEISSENDRKIMIMKTWMLAQNEDLEEKDQRKDERNVIL